MLPLKPLGRNGPDLSVVGLGAWAIGGPGPYPSFGPQTDAVSIATIQRALDNGINWIDTAPSYGGGHSEVIVGRAVKRRRHEVLLATKCTKLWDAEGNTRVVGAAASVRQECEQSLRRLGVDHIDLLQIHSPVDDVPIEETWTELVALMDEGKVRFLGVSNFSVGLIQQCLAIRHVDSVQPCYNLMTRDIEEELLPFCQREGIGVVPYGPMAEGLLSGSFDKSRLHAGDFRSEPWMRPRIQRAGMLVHRLRPIADQLGMTVGQLCIAWVLAHPAVTSVIVGARSPDQVVENVQAEWRAEPWLRPAVDAILADLEPYSVEDDD